MKLRAVLFIGAGSALGESVMLGHLKRFPPRLVSGWSSGTGGAGLVGAGMFVVLESMGLSYSAIFLLSVPLVAVYVLLFFVYLRGPTAEMQAELRAMQKGSDAEGDALGQAEAEALLGEGSAVEEEKVPPMTWARLKRALWLSRYYSINLGLVYLLEYAISAGFAAYALPVSSENQDKYAYREAFEIFAMCYQVGVFISRSSLPLVKITNLNAVTALQTLNFALWLLQCLVQPSFVGPYTLFAAMVFVGLLGGASYVNTWYLLMRDPKIRPDERELVVNIVALAVTVGIVASSVLVVGLNDTIFRDLVA